MSERDTVHLDPATIAALVDRTIEPAARAEAEAHLAVCADCRDVWAETSEIQQESEAAEAAPSGDATMVTTRRTPWRWLSAGAGIAASLMLAVSLWGGYQNRRVDRAIAELAGESRPERMTSARLSEPFAWGPRPSARRSGIAGEPSAAIQARALALRQLAADRPSAATLRASGLGALALGKVDDAVAALAEATRLDGRHVEAHVDLSAALLERWAVTGEEVDARRALDAARRAVQLDPANAAARFNTAVALEAAGRRAEAIQAWREYLTTDTTSPWSDEARERLAALQR